MKPKLIGLILLIAGVIALTMPGQGQKTSTIAKEKPHRQRNLPIVDFAEPKPAEATLLAKQRVKASRYDRRSSQVIEEGYMIDGRKWSSHWSSDLTALPFAQSDVVLIGTVMSSKAHLSNDKTGIYSEFEVQVEEALKNALKDSNDIGATVYLERFGGAVRFPSGVIQKYEVTGQGMPGLGERYLFFLKRMDKTDFSILTGYQLDGEVVTPLDGAVVEEGNSVYPFDKYQNSAVSIFLQTARNAANRK
jgi:hypothetical protein